MGADLSTTRAHHQRLRAQVALGLATVVIATAAACGSRDAPTTSARVDHTSAAPRRTGAGTAYFGRIGNHRFRIPASLVLSTVTTEAGPNWGPRLAEPNSFAREIRYFDLRLPRLLPGSPTTPPAQRSLNQRGFVEADVFVVTPAKVKAGVRALLATDLAGRGLGGSYLEVAAVAGMRHWRAVRPPTGAAVNTDLFLDEKAGLAVRCTGGDRYAVRGRGLCEQSFYVARHGLLINASFSGADLTSAREIKHELETTLTSFVIQDRREAERAPH